MKNGFLSTILIGMIPMIFTAYRKASADSGSQTEKGAYFITKISGNINWKSIPVLPVDKVLWTEDAGIRAHGQLCYDEQNLYVHLSAVEKSIRAENTAPLSPVHEDSCLEFFFKLKDAKNYFNFEVNPNGCLVIQFGPRRGDRVNLVRNDAAEYFDIQTGRTSEGWEVFYRIPIEFIRLFYPDYRFEGELTANMYKCGDETKHPHYLSWSGINLETPDFHCPEFFGNLYFA